MRIGLVPGAARVAPADPPGTTGPATGPHDGPHDGPHGGPRRPRDAQRARVYRAESAVASSPLPGLDACRHFAERVVGSLWWAARFPACDLGGLPRFRPGNGARQAFFRDEPTGPTITLPRRYRTKGVVLHELVHWALWADPGLPHHGTTFVRVLVDATAEFVGPDRAADLAAAVAAAGVRIGAPAVTGPDGRIVYGADEHRRLARSRARTAAAAAAADAAEAARPGVSRSGGAPPGTPGRARRSSRPSGGSGRG